MLRPPPRSTLFPSRRSSDLGGRSRHPHRGRRRGSSRRPPVVLRRRSQCSQSPRARSEEHTSELQSRVDLVCRLLLEKKKKKKKQRNIKRQTINTTYKSNYV